MGHLNSPAGFGDDEAAFEDGLDILGGGPVEHAEPSSAADRSWREDLRAFLGWASRSSQLGSRSFEIDVQFGIYKVGHCSRVWASKEFRRAVSPVLMRKPVAAA
jgi:hypothetical protein